MAIVYMTQMDDGACCSFELSRRGRLRMCMHGTQSAEYDVEALLSGHNAGHYQLPVTTLAKIKRAKQKAGLE